MTRPTALLAGGNGAAGFVDGIGAAARFNHPAGLCLSADQATLYVCDYSNNALRAVNLNTTEVTTVAQDAVLMKEPTHCCLGPVSGDIYVSCHDGGGFRGRIVRVTPAGSITTISAAAVQTRGIACDPGETFLHGASDGGNHLGEVWVGQYVRVNMAGSFLQVTRMQIFIDTTPGALSTNGFFYLSNASSRSGLNPYPAGLVLCETNGNLDPLEGNLGDIGGGGIGGSNGDMVAWQDGDGHHLTLARGGVLRDCLLTSDGRNVARYETVSESGYSVWGAERDSNGNFYFSSNSMYPDDFLSNGSQYHWTLFGGLHSIFHLRGGWTVGYIGMG